MSGAAGIPAVHGGEEVNATVMSSRAPAVDADVLAARPSEDTRLFRAARAFFDTACLVYSPYGSDPCGRIAAS